MAKIATRWVLSGEITGVGFTPDGSQCLALSRNELHLAVATKGPDRYQDYRFEMQRNACRSKVIRRPQHTVIRPSGTVSAAMDIKSKDVGPNEVIKVIEPTSTESMTRIPVLWHPSSEFFVIGKDKDIAAHNRHTWRKSFTYQTRTAQGDTVGKVSCWTLDDFIVEDETGTYLEKRYLAFNLLGLITSIGHGTHAKVSVEFRGKVAHRGFHFMDNFRYSMACLGLTGTLFTAVAKDGKPSTVFYKTYDSWATKPEWQVYLPGGECYSHRAQRRIGHCGDFARTCTDILQSGIQRALFSVGSVIAAAGKDDLVILIYHQGEPFQALGSQNLEYSIYNVESGRRIQHGSMPVADDNRSGAMDPILGAMLIDVDAAFRPHYLPIGLTDQASTCIKCCRGEYEPSYHKTVVTELALKMPTLYQDTSTGKHEEAWLRHKILSGLTKDGKMAGLFGRKDNTVAKKELEMDKKVLQMIDLACKADRTQKSLDLTAMLCKVISIDAAVKMAYHSNLYSDGWSKRITVRVGRRVVRIRQDQALEPTAASTSTSAEAKRLKTQRDEDADMEMDADDMLEDAAGDSDGGEEAVPALAVIPERQEDLEESIEHTSGHLEKRRVELSPARTSSSVLSGFNINGA
ncbi:MAG: hypothetical protein J3Q66DRAFT_439688 [Benniella sp.]|nr:MAG: hypothetical protein J3Q66DRAFT_439688 [Benniella sp.]